MQRNFRSDFRNAKRSFEWLLLPRAANSTRRPVRVLDRKYGFSGSTRARHQRARPFSCGRQLVEDGARYSGRGGLRCSRNCSHKFSGIHRFYSCAPQAAHDRNRLRQLDGGVSFRTGNSKRAWMSRLTLRPTIRAQLVSTI